jgi:hypothetical protein
LRVGVKPGGHFSRFSRKPALSAVERQRCYQPDQIDVIAALCRAAAGVYVIPIGALGSRQKIALYPNNKNSRGQFERYREAWALMSAIGPAEPT